MSRIVIVPDALEQAFQKEIARFIAEHPEAECEREQMYQELLGGWDEHGVVGMLMPPDPVPPAEGGA